jgi:hypothetical protein
MFTQKLGNHLPDNTSNNPDDYNLNIKGYLEETRHMYVHWVHLPQDRIQGKALVHKVMDLQVLQEPGNFLST